MATWYHVTAPYPPLHVQPGDVIRYEPGSEDPVEIYRPLGEDSVGAFWRAVQAGAVTPVSDDATPELDLHRAVPAAPVPPDDAEPRPPLRMVR